MILNVPALPLRAQPNIQHDCRPACIRNRNIQPSLNQGQLRKIPVDNSAQQVIFPKRVVSKLPSRRRPPEPHGKRTHSRYNDT
jgi:hypothetical protein